MRSGLIEAGIEIPVVYYAEARGCMVLKLNVTGRKGWPDRLFIAHDKRIMFVEFKRPGGKPRKLQAHILKQLTENGHRVEVIDNVEAGKKLLREFLGAVT
jgi:hypothetical protein